MSIDSIWKQILRHEGELFYTATGLAFTYIVINEYTIQPFREGNGRWPLNKKLFEKALEFKSISSTEFNKKIVGSSYVRGILLDSRISEFWKA